MESRTSSEIQKFVSSQIEGTMKDWLGRIGRQREIKDRLGVIEYMGFEQYLRQENWDGEFDREEVQSWLEDY
ncbi:hypothetical protein I302_107558 [Kwoniella bestiolae CBS 10118]|uniref:Uncharacterized protein n=1 Tax=Kwoniella bestiolae CBS 10118 TaxID=1296100 RepID=A0AAJ8KDG2_9TREE